MKFLSTAAALFGLLAGNALAQDVKYDSEHNMTSLGGTWASGSQKVLTGPVSIISRVVRNKSSPTAVIGFRTAVQHVLHIPTSHWYLVLLVSLPLFVTIFRMLIIKQYQ